MAWIDDTIWWHVYPLGFTGVPVREADVAPAARLRHVTEWLDYAIELGASGLLLGPLFTSSTHGYDSTDQFQIDPRLGTIEDFEALVSACRIRGIRVVLDGVFNHVGAQHPLFVTALQNGPASPEAALFRIDWAAPGGPQPAVFEGHDSLVALDHNNPAVADYVVDVMSFWLDRGIDGWRLDAAYAVDPAFWSVALPRVRARHPETWIVGEVIHGDYAEFVAQSGVDSVTQYELWKAIWSSVKERNFFELDWTLTRHNVFLETFTPATFVGNHDVTRIASAVGHDLAEVALVILMTVGGIPAIYYGDEQGLTGVKEERVGGDDAIRPAFPAHPTQFSAQGAETYRTHQALIGLRRRHPWLTTATTEPLELTNTHYRYRALAADQSASLIVDLDITDRPQASIQADDGHLVWRLVR